MGRISADGGVEVDRLLFRTQDLSQIKAYCQAQWKKLMLGDVSPQDFTYAKEVKMGNYRQVIAI